MNIDPLTQTAIGTYNRLFANKIDIPLLEMFLEIGIGLVPLEAEEPYIHRLVRLLAEADNDETDINTINMRLQQVQNFYNETIATYELAGHLDPDEEQAQRLEATLVAFLEMLDVDEVRTVLQAMSEKAVVTIAVEYGFEVELMTVADMQGLERVVQAAFGQLEVLTAGFFTLMDISQMLKKGAEEDEFFGFTVALTIVLSTFNAVRKQQIELINKKPISLEVIRKRYSGKISQLFDLGRDLLDDDTFSYRELGLSGKNKKQLLALADEMDLYDYPFEDDDESPDFFAVTHAWWALSEFEIPEAKVLFVKLLERSLSDIEDDWMPSMFRKLVVPFRASMYEETVSSILDESRDQWIRIEFIELLGDMLKHNEVDTERSRLIIGQLFAKCDDPIVNATGISICKEHGFSEHYPVISTLYEKGLVDYDMDGDLEDVEIAFKMKTDRTRPRQRSTLFQNSRVKEIEDMLPTSPLERTGVKVGRNDPCPCGSGKKYKKCCMKK